MESPTKTTTTIPEKTQRLKVTFPFWLKLSSFSILLTFLVMGGVFYFVYKEESRTIEAGLVRDLSRTEVFRRHLEDKRRTHLSEVATEMKFNSALVSFIRSSSQVSNEDLFGFGGGVTKNSLKENSEKILSTLENNYPIYDDAPVFVLVNQNGEILLNKRHPDQFGDDLTPWPIVGKSLEGKNLMSSDWWHGQKWDNFLPQDHDDQLYAISPFSLKDQGGVYGVMLIGRKVLDESGEAFSDDGFGQTYLNFLMGHNILASQLSPDEQKALVTILKEDPNLNSHRLEGGTVRLRLGGNEFIGKISHQQDCEGRTQDILVLKNFSLPLQAKLKTFLEILTQLAIVAGILTLLLSLLFSRFLSEPIKVLIGAVSKIGQGDFSARVDLKTHDEMGVLGAAFNQMGEDLGTGNFLEGAMKKYIPAELVDQLKENRQLAELGGTKTELSIYFSDIVGFTPISESLSPEALIEWLNQYMSHMSNIIQGNQGNIDKFIGDAIMAFWNAPRSVAGHPSFAAKAALEQQRWLHGKDLPWGEEIGQVGCRIGLHFGEAIVGNMGSEDSQNYTAIGDAVNLASRLEGANRQYGTRILISEDFKNQLDDQFLCRPLDRIVVKGKTKPVTIFELMEEKPFITEDMEKSCETWSTLIDLYQDRQFKKVISTLETMGPFDPLMKIYFQRCRNFLDSPPSKDWQGETHLNEK
jgi:class 3 adenylate cyclase